jgi:hypothetical protein
MFSQGQVLPCELQTDRVIGNVRDYDYDFKALWYSERAEELRRYIRDTKCFCTYECFLTINMLFNPLVLPSIATEWMRLKAAKLKHRLTGGTPATLATTPAQDKTEG